MEFLDPVSHIPPRRTFDVADGLTEQNLVVGELFNIAAVEDQKTNLELVYCPGATVGGNGNRTTQQTKGGAQSRGGKIAESHREIADGTGATIYRLTTDLAIVAEGAQLHTNLPRPTAIRFTQLGKANRQLPAAAVAGIGVFACQGIGIAFFGQRRAIALCHQLIEIVGARGQCRSQ